MQSFDFIEEAPQPSLALSEDSYRYREFELEFGGLEQFPEERDPSECFHPLNPDYEDLKQRVNGLAFRESFKPILAPKLPGYLPQVFPRNVRNVPVALLGSFAVQYHQLPFLVKGRFDPKSFMRVGRWPRSSVILITGNSKDHRLEKVWHASYGDAFWRGLGGLPNVLLVAPDFSVYTHYNLGQAWRQGRFEQRFNMKRALDFCRRASAKGLPCALPIAYSTRRDLELWCEYLRGAGSAIYLLCLNIQTQAKTVPLQPQLIHAVEEQVGRPFQWIVQGVGEEEGFRHFKDAALLERVSFVSTAEQMLALKRQDIYRRQRPGVDPRRLLLANIGEKRRILQAVANGTSNLPFDSADEGLQMSLPELIVGEPFAYRSAG